MNTLKYPQLSWRPALALCFLAFVGRAHAGIGDTPFSLKLGQSFLHDSNVERSESGRSDTISSTSAAVVFDKEYGRQSYSATLQSVIQRYQDLTVYNNTAISADVSAATEIGLRSKMDIKYQYDKSIQSFEDQGLNARSRKAVISNQAYVNAYYGLHSQWKLVGNLSFTKTDFERSAAENRDSRSLRLGVRHEPSDLLYMEAGARQTLTDYPQLTVFTGPTTSYLGNRVKRADLDFRTGWTITSNSKLTGQINLTNEKNESLKTGESGDVARNYNGLTGKFNWDYTPRGKLAYNIKLTRDTNNNGGYSTKVSSVAQEKLNTSLDLNAAWFATAKVVVRANLGLQRIEEFEEQRIPSRILSETSTGTKRTATLSAEYELNRSWYFSCAIARIDRTRTILNSGYLSNSMSCSGEFSMD